MNDKDIKNLIKINYRLKTTVAKKTKRTNIYKNATKNLETENLKLKSNIDQKSEELQKLMQVRSKDKDEQKKKEEEIENLK